MKFIPDFDDSKARIDWLIKNKSLVIAQKKSAIKESDAVTSNLFYFDKSDQAYKAGTVEFNEIAQDAKQIKVRSIINTTKLFDSHGDVHLDQLWNKSLSESKSFYLVKEHNFSFDGIISDNVKAFVKQMTWHELGINYEGKTQALIFDTVIDKDESDKMVSKMFDMYKAGKVTQHSVGMRYVKMDMAVNNDRYEKEYKVWEKYFDQIANKEDALEAGYFFPVMEAKIIEGSAVVKGSNWATPTLAVQQTKGEPDDTTRKAQPIITADMLLSQYQIKV